MVSNHTGMEFCYFACLPTCIANHPFANFSVKITVFQIPTPCTLGYNTMKYKWQASTAFDSSSFHKQYQAKVCAN